jgi:hypothetical protein
MSRVITFSRTFPSYHTKAGQPTYFAEKIVKSLHWERMHPPYDIRLDFNLDAYVNSSPKHHTIRAGKRWKAGDWFSPRVWSGKPYNSKQITIAPDIQIKKVWNIGLRVRGDFKELFSGDADLTGTSISSIATNDGLTVEDLLSWFNKPFEGQIICWNDQIEY